MKNIFIYLIICLLSVSALHAQHTPYVLQTDIWYDSEQPANSLQNRNISKGNLQKRTSEQDSSVLLNFHSVQSFTEQVSPFKSLYDIAKTSRLTVIVVFHSPDTAAEHGIWQVVRDGKQITGLTDKRLLRQKSEYRYPTKKRGIPLINTSMQAFSKIRGKADSNYFVLGAAVLPDSALSSFSGDIAECLVFNRFLKKQDALKIETYLAVKYGITLIESDYISPSEVVLWNYEANKEYSNAMAGIGKDTTFGLNQKQGTSGEEDNLLTISVGDISTLNKNNNFALPEANYLIWGHNDKALIYNNIDCDKNYPLLERKWLIQTTYTANNRFPTKVRFSLPEQYRDTNSTCYLVIDRSGTGDFTAQNIEYIAQNQIDIGGYVYFDDVIWDTDNSGKDAFTFSFGAVIEAVAINSCPNASTGTIAVNICGGKSPFNYMLTGNNQQITYQGGRNYTFENLPVGEYLLTIIDSNNLSTFKRLEIEEFENITSSLPLRYAIKDSDNNFNAEEYFDVSAMNYLWEKDSVFYSNNPLIDMSLPGNYTLTLSDMNGCFYLFHILAEENLLSKNKKSLSGKDMPKMTDRETEYPQYKVYPNPTKGKYTVEADFQEESDIVIRVITADGSLLSTWRDRGKKHYVFDSYITTAGSYIIEIESLYEQKSFTISVVK
jgi:hypothetical protein